MMSRMSLARIGGQPREFVSGMTAQTAANYRSVWSLSVMFVRLFLLVLLGLGPVAAVHGEDPDAAERQSALHFLLGSWDAQARFYDGEQDLWVETSATRLTGETIMGGGVVELSGDIAFTGATFRNRLTFSYDPFRQHYRLAVLDDLYHFMDIYSGDVSENGVLDLDNLTTGSAIPLESGLMAGRLQFALHAERPGFTLEAEISTDQGETWDAYMVVDFTPAN